MCVCMVCLYVYIKLTDHIQIKFEMEPFIETTHIHTHIIPLKSHTDNEFFLAISIPSLDFVPWFFGIPTDLKPLKKVQADVMTFIM